MWTTEWPIDELRRFDRKVRSIISECSGRHPRESTPIFCMERKEGGRGGICVEETYHVMKLKTAHYVNTCIDPRLRQVKDLERMKQEKGRRNIFTDALKARSEVQLDIQFNLDESTTVVRIDQDRTTEICTSKPNMLTKYLKKALQLKHQEAIKSQNWQGKFLGTVWNDEDLAEQYFAYMGWKNISDYIETTHVEIMQQLLPTYVYQKERLNKQDLPVVCRACNSSEENLYHVMCNCPRLAQDLYKSRHDGILIHLHRAILDKNGIPPDNSKFSKPELCIEKENVKILWDTPLQLPYATNSGANKPDITEIDHEQKLIILYEGTVCAVRKRHQKWNEKQNKYAECRAGLQNLYEYEGYTIKQVNIVSDFIGGYNKNLFKNLSEAIPKDTMKIKKLIDNMQRAVLFGNYNIVRRFKAF